MFFVFFVLFMRVKSFHKKKQTKKTALVPSTILLLGTSVMKEFLNRICRMILPEGGSSWHWREITNQQRENSKKLKIMSLLTSSKFQSMLWLVWLIKCLEGCPLDARRLFNVDTTFYRLWNDVMCQWNKLLECIF